MVVEEDKEEQKTALLLVVFETEQKELSDMLFFVRWFWAPFFEQVVKAVGVLVIPSVSDALPSC